MAKAWLVAVLLKRDEVVFNMDWQHGDICFTENG
jgi:hypothetical protein